MGRTPPAGLMPRPARESRSQHEALRDTALRPADSQMHIAKNLVPVGVCGVLE